MTLVLTLLCHGCPIQAIVAAFGFDERTVVAWQVRAGQHCEQVHEHLVLQGRADLGHVQADELWVKMVGRRGWMAMAMAMAGPSRLWLGGGISPHRDRALIQSLVEKVRAAAASPALRVCVDGLARHGTAFLRVFRHPISTGKRGRPRLVVEPGLLIGRVIKQYAEGRVVSVNQRGIRGTPEAIAGVRKATGTGQGINTAFLERLNATLPRFGPLWCPWCVGVEPWPPSRACSKPRCTWWARLTPSAGITRASVSLLSKEQAGSGTRARRRWPLGLRTTAGRCSSCCRTRCRCQPGWLRRVEAAHPSKPNDRLWRWQRDPS